MFAPVILAQEVGDVLVGVSIVLCWVSKMAYRVSKLVQCLPNVLLRVVEMVEEVGEVVEG